MECLESKCRPAEFVKTTLFKKGCDFTYRIPSLLYLPGTNTYLAFAEKRTSAGDVDAKCFVIRRMTTNVHPTQVNYLYSKSLSMTPCYAFITRSSNITVISSGSQLVGRDPQVGGEGLITNDTCWS